MSRYLVLFPVLVMVGCYQTLDETDIEYPATTPPKGCTVKMSDDYWSWINLQHCLDAKGKPVTLVIDPKTGVCSWSAPQTCKMDKDCDMAAGGAGKGVCDKSCGCCVTKCEPKPADGTNVCRYQTLACNADGTCPPPPANMQGNFGWFSPKCGLKCGTFSSTMCVFVDPAAPYCLYEATLDAKNCSDACASGGFRKYECGGTNCDGNVVVGCTAGPNNGASAWNFKKVDDTCPKKKPATKKVSVDGGSYCVDCLQYEVDNGTCADDCDQPPLCGTCQPGQVCLTCSPGGCNTSTSTSTSMSTKSAPPYTPAGN